MKALSGVAYKEIKSLPMTNESYEIARNMLDDRFNHKRKLAHTYMTKLLGYKPITTENSEALIDFISNTKECLISLQDLNLPTDSWDYILLYNLQSKIPHHTLLKWKKS